MSASVSGSESGRCRREWTKMLEGLLPEHCHIAYVLLKMTLC